MELTKKVIVIIGGSQGFGKQLAIGFINEGCQVAIVSKTKESVEQTAREIGATAFTADVRHEDEIRIVAEQIVKKFGTIDIWINCAGVFHVFPKDELINLEQAHELFDINFFGTVFGSRTALIHMQASGGIIINVLSSAALDATRAKNAKLYAASKWAVRGYVEALRGENKQSAVIILSVYPGGMKTQLHDEALPADFENFMDPKDVAQKVIDNLKQANPEQDLIIKRPVVKS